MDKAALTAQIFKPLDGSALLQLVLIVAATVLFIVVEQRLLPRIARRLHGLVRLRLLALVPLIRLFAIVAALFWALPLVIEPSLQNMVALLGTVGLALGFALKDYASSLIAGFVVMGEKNYRNGDWIRIGDVYGEVRHVGLRTVEVVTRDDDRVLIPHSRIWHNPVFNANNGAPRLQCQADFHLHPDHDAAPVRQVLEDVALTSVYLHVEGGVSVSVRENPWGTRYRIRVYPVDGAQQFRIVSDLTVRGKAALRDLGVTFVVVPALEKSR